MMELVGISCLVIYNSDDRSVGIDSLGLNGHKLALLPSLIVTATTLQMDEHNMSTTRFIDTSELMRRPFLFNVSGVNL